MQTQRSHTLTPHRLARLTAWLLALLVWFACGGGPGRRHRRYGHIKIERLRTAVRNLILIGAADLVAAQLQGKPRNVARIDARAGAIVRCCSLRAVAGTWLRRRLHARGSFAAQVARLIVAVRDWRKLAASLAYRRRKGLSRLISLIPTPAPAARLRARHFIALRPADTS